MTCNRRADSMWPRCQCPDCRRERARIIKLWRSGLHPVIDRHAAVDRVNDWLALGFTRQWIASACGIDPRAVDRIADRGSLPMPRRAQRILTAKISNGSAGFGPSVGIARRLQALTVMGHTLASMSTETGIPTPTLSNARDESVAYVRAAHWHAIAAMYDRISMTRGPSSRGVVRARNRGWLPPLAWDDDSIDDPNATPADARNDPTHRFAGRPNADVAEDTAWLLESDAALTTQQAADRLGMRVDSLQQALRRAGEHDMAQRLALNAELTNNANGRRSA